jgi:hypothetical protein
MDCPKPSPTLSLSNTNLYPDSLPPLVLKDTKAKLYLDCWMGFLACVSEEGSIPTRAMI